MNNADIFNALKREEVRYREQFTANSSVDSHRKPVSHSQFETTLLNCAFAHEQSKKKTLEEEQNAHSMLKNHIQRMNDVSQNVIHLLKQRCEKLEKRQQLEVTKESLMSQIPVLDLMLQRRAIFMQKSSTASEANNENGTNGHFSLKKQTRFATVQTDCVMNDQNSSMRKQNGIHHSIFNREIPNNNDISNEQSNMEEEECNDSLQNAQEDTKPNPFKTANELLKNNRNKQLQRNNCDKSAHKDIRQTTNKTNVDFKTNPAMYSINKSKEVGDGKKTAGSKKRKFNPPRSIGEGSQQEEKAGKKKPRTNESISNEENPNSNTAFSIFPNGEIPEELSHLDAKLVESICHDILLHDAGVSWDDIAGLAGPKRTIYEIVIWPMKRPDLFYGIRGPPKGVLLFGPPGTGKTLIAKAVATESKSTFFSISASSITSKWIGEGERLVRTLFAIARYLQPSVIFIDEIDSLLSARSDSDEDNGTKRIKTEFLIQLDGASTDSSDRILVLGATNLPHTIDEAVRRRLVKRIYIPLPDRPARLNLLKRTLDKSRISYQLSEKDFEKILEWTEGYSGSDLAAYVTDAAMGPVREINPKMIESVDVRDVRPVQIKDFKKARNNIRASVNPAEIKRYEEWDKEYGCRYTEDDDGSHSQED
jgi:SpoVK/Ycf46/Vps4 family AAA+-type ATPase